MCIRDRNRITASPGDLANYVDLGHQYMLDKRFDDAVHILEKAILRAFGSGDADSGSERLWSEVDRIISMQYEYGTKEDLAVARAKVCEMLERVLKKYPAGCAPFYRNYVTVLAELGQTDRARTTLEVALRRFPDDRALRQMEKYIYRRR